MRIFGLGLDTGEERDGQFYEGTKAWEEMR
jgi:hypothetical protein